MKEADEMGLTVIAVCACRRCADNEKPSRIALNMESGQFYASAIGHDSFDRISAKYLAQFMAGWRTMTEKGSL